ncbi:glycoside hydrolase family 16 protein [Sporormia fimetaria CBS 119925]|uniref:Glycoside hydrolase family 16 protein n=1 Tax=Sporormia fimetaria CBS 119925 TaxID=1340428 RepID=A0A6A6V6W7_9PLEO|nr:glycoside hydrolase family 16 protein [Sporormia fimetaria CBS 119925]
MSSPPENPDKPQVRVYQLRATSDTSITQPPPYTEVSHEQPPTRLSSPPPPPPEDTSNWKRYVFIIIVGCALILGGVLGGLIPSKSSKQSNYSRVEYRLIDTYPASTFFNHFTFFTAPDPTHGFVTYQSRAASESQDLTFYHALPQNSTTLPLTLPQPNNTSPESQTSAILRVSTAPLAHNATGRPSVRIASTRTYNTTTLFLFSILHTPHGCGTWPALWLLGPKWPAGGEIDVLEAVNKGDTGNSMTLHTARGCTMSSQRSRRHLGTAKTWDCWNATNWNAGCGVQGQQETYGEVFNANGGGLYAVEVRDEGIRVWMFGERDVPGDVRSGTPDPSIWGLPLAEFPGAQCEVGKFFRDLRIVVNIGLCGDWAGAPGVYEEGAKCSGKCEDWVRNHGESFEEAYWEFGGFWVFKSE